MANFKIIEGEKRNIKTFISKGFSYVKNKENKNHVYLKCQFNKHCKGRARIKKPNEDILEETVSQTCL